MKNIFVIVGSSGSGKTAIGKKAFGASNELVSHTTRKKRPNEKNGIDYHFVSKNEMYELIKTNQLVEHSIYNGELYGISKKEIEAKTQKSDTFFVTDKNGLKAITELYPDNAISVFIDVPKKILNDRLIKRKEPNITERLNLFEEEQKLKKLTRYTIKNIDFRQAVRSMITLATKHR